MADSGQPVQSAIGHGNRQTSLPGWAWLLIGVLVGLLISAAVIFWMPEVVGLQPIEATPAALIEEATDSEELPTETETPQPEAP